jgi:hypothetical protein
MDRRGAAAPADAVGRVRMITMLTALKPWGLLRLRLEFLATRLWPGLMGIRPLRSLYSTRWSLLTALPYNGPPQLPERPRRPQLLWETDYSAPVEPYIEAFIAATSRQIRRTWGSSYDFPGTGSVTGLRNYIEGFSRPAAHSYCAYPDASVRMILSALAVAQEHEYLLAAARSPDAAAFAVAYRGFLARRQGDL